MDELEARAAAERRRLQEDVSELRQTVRERLDVKRYVRDHGGRVAWAMALLGLALGYLTAGVFIRRIQS
jgi:hypothetical protein